MENRTIVVKLGTSVLTGGSSQLNRAHMVELVRQCAALHRHGHRVVVVTSGAIAAGREHLGHPPLAPTLPKDHIIVMNMCGRGDKDIFTVAKHLGVQMKV